MLKTKVHSRTREWVVEWHLVPRRRAARLRHWLRQRVEKDSSPLDIFEPLKGVNSVGDLWLALTFIGVLALIILAAPILLLVIEVLLLVLAIASALISLLFLRRPIRITATSGKRSYTWLTRSIIQSLLVRRQVIATLAKGVDPRKIPGRE